MRSFRRLDREDWREAVAGVAVSVARRVRELDGFLGDLRSLAPVSWYGRQPVSSSVFLGRAAVMWEIHSGLHAGELRPMTGAAGPGVVQLRGLGGIGKTLLAEEYALRFAASYPGGVFWLSALGGSEGSGQLTSAERSAEQARQVIALAVALGAPVDGLSDASEFRAALRQELDRRGEAYLWVVDDVPSGLGAGELRRWFAPHPLGKTLLTTRSRRYEALGVMVEPGVLEPDEAAELLARHRAPVGESETLEAGRLAEDLGFHALALEVAGAALAVAAGPSPYAGFRMALADSGEDELEFAGELTERAAQRPSAEHRRHAAWQRHGPGERSG